MPSDVREDSTVLFVGYQSQGTLGRRIIDGAKSVKLFGETIAVNCRVENLDSLRDYPGYLSEIIVANPKNRDERARWKDIQPKKVRYYDLKG